MNTQFELLRQSPTVAMADRVAALKAGGRKITGLTAGDPDFDTPRPILDAALQAMQAGLTHYGPSRGLPELRQAVALKLERDNGVIYDPQGEILVTHGGVHAYYAALQTLLNPGDEVLIPDPTWATHVNVVTMLRGRAVRVPGPAENGFIPPIEAWEQALTPKSRLLVINYPANPTGAVPPGEYLAQLQELAARHGLWVVSDEVYENLFFTPARPACAAAFPGAKERTILVGSLSKTYAMTGWRVGYLAGPETLVENALKAGQNSITCVAPFIQKAAAFALSDPGMQAEAAAMRRRYALRRDLVLKAAHSAAHSGGESPVRVTPPQGAFYFFLDVRLLQRPSMEICEQLLEETGVAVLPGSVFGEQGEGFLRMAIAASEADIEAGFRAILAWAEKQA
jgi:aspartate/methionine/tyrosine aminotransferase